MSKKYLGIARIFILSMFLFFPTIVYADIFFQDGFESGVLINQQIWEWIANNPNDPCYSDGQIVPTTEDRFSGAYSAKFILPAGDMCTSMYSQFSRSVGQGEDIYFRFRLKYSANREWNLGGGDKVVGFFGNSRAPGGEWILFTLERGYHDTTEIPVPNDPHMAQPLIYVAAANTNGWRPCNDPDGSYFCQNIDQGNPFYITAGQWYTVEIYVKVDAYGAGQLKLWIDGKQLIDINNIYTTRGDNNPGFYRFELGGTLNQPDYVFPVDTVSYWDDIIISDTCNSCDSPSAQIINPTNSGSYTTTSATLNISGTASDPGGTNIGITSVTWSNNRGGSGTATGTTNWLVSNVPLQSGRNTITVTATDGDGKTATDILVVTVTTSGGGGDTGGNTSSSGDSSASGGSGCGFVKDDGKGQGAKGEGLTLMVMLIITLATIAIAKKALKRKVTTGKVRRKLLNFKSGMILLIVLLLFIAYTPAHATVYFYYDAENETVDSNVPREPNGIDICTQGCTSVGSDATVQSAGGAPQGSKYFQWVTVDNQPSVYTEVINHTTFPISLSLGTTYYLAYFFNFTRINGLDIWHETGQSADKGVEIDGSGIRWILSRGNWSCIADTQDHYYTVWTGNPTYVLNPSPIPNCVDNIFGGNQNGYTASNPIQLEYERWHSAVMAVKIASNNTGSVTFWIDGVKIGEYNNIITSANNSPTINYITMGGTIAQGANDAPAHYRKFDALMLTDNWQDIVDGGYLSGSGDTPPPSGGNPPSNNSDSTSGGSGCGFVKDDGKGQRAKGEGLSIILLFLPLILLWLRKRHKYFITSLNSFEHA